MAASILHRVTGAAQYGGAILITVWLAAAAMGDDAYTTVQSIFGSPLGLMILVGYTWSISFHLINGLRFLFWDAGYGFSKETATLTGWVAFVGSIILTSLIWAMAMVMGAGS